MNTVFVCVRSSILATQPGRFALETPTQRVLAVLYTMAITLDHKWTYMFCTPCLQPNGPGMDHLTQLDESGAFLSWVIGIRPKELLIINP